VSGVAFGALRNPEPWKSAGTPQDFGRFNYRERELAALKGRSTGLQEFYIRLYLSSRETFGKFTLRR
jgi:hypothetical protein